MKLVSSIMDWAERSTLIEKLVASMITAAVGLICFTVVDYSFGDRDTYVLEVAGKHHTPAQLITEATGDKNMPTRTRMVPDSYDIALRYQGKILKRSVTAEVFYSTDVGDSASATVVTGAITGHTY